MGIVADTGFRPDTNGFSFSNYGNGALSDGSIPTNLTVRDMRAMFGDVVCADTKAGLCDLIPEAQAWLTSTNAKMAGGHCFGFSVAAELLWLRQLKSNHLGAATTTALAIPRNQALQRLIAYDWSLQLLQSVRSHAVSGSPNHILESLEAALKPKPAETYTIVFFKSNGSGGHAVTPYAVENLGHGRFGVLIYDNNWPKTTRTIDFNTESDTWSYDASTQPNQLSALYKGDADTKSIYLFPTSPGIGTQPCPFCDKVPQTAATAAASEYPSSVTSSGALPGGSPTATEEIYALGSTNRPANVMVTDGAGQRLGYVDGKLVDEIPGANVDPVIAGGRDWREQVAPDFFVPANATYTITVDGNGLTRADTETLGVIGPDSDASVGGIAIAPGDRDSLVVQPDVSRLLYRTSRAAGNVAVDVGVSDEQADYAFDIGGVSVSSGSTFLVDLPREAGTLTLEQVGSSPVSNAVFHLQRDGAQGVQTFRNDAIPFGGGDTAQFQFGGWTGPSGEMPLNMTHLGHETTRTLVNQS
jgi:hypothetical protein